MKMGRVTVYIFPRTKTEGPPGDGRVVHSVSEYKLKFTSDQAKEMPMVDVAFEILRAANTPFYYRDLMKEIAKVKDLTEEQIKEVIAQVYTEINIDGRFACVGQNLWGLKRWYPVEKGDEAVSGNSKRPRIINDEDDEEEDLYVEEEEETYDLEDGEDYDALDEDHEEFADDDEVEEELDEEEADEVELDEETDDEEEHEEEDLDELDEEEEK